MLRREFVISSALALLPRQIFGRAASSYPIRKQPGIYPPEAGGWNLGDLPPAGQGITQATAWMFMMNNIYDRRTPTIDVDYLAVKGSVNGQTVVVDMDNYGTGPGQTKQVWGDWAPRSNFTDPSLEIPGPIVSGWAATYFECNSDPNHQYALQIWNAAPGLIPPGVTKLWSEANVRINGSGLICFGFDFYDATSNYVGNAGYSGFHFYLPARATPSWQVITWGT
jgi:hypothetical protein